MAIKFNTVDFEDYKQYLDGDIAVGDIVYGFLMTDMRYQILPRKILDKHEITNSDGVNVYSGYYGSREITIDGLVIATTHTALTTQLTALANLLNVQTVKAFLVSYLETDPTAPVREWKAILKTPIPRTTDGHCTTTALSLTFEIPQPFAEGDAVTQNDTTDNIVYTR